MLDLDCTVHSVDYGGTGLPIVLVHGLAGSIENWGSVAAPLTNFGHVVALDLLGFGRTPRPHGRPSTIANNLSLLDRFIDQIADRPVLLMGNSMGGLISMLEAGAEPAKVAGLVLVDAVGPLPPGTVVDPMVQATFAGYLGPDAEEIVRRTASQIGVEGMARATLALCCVDPARVDPAVVDDLIHLAHERSGFEWAATSLIEAARSLLEVTFDPDRYYDAMRSVVAPTLLVHGARDRLVPASVANTAARIRPDWRVEILDDTGHVPQLEAPDRLLRITVDWLREQKLA